MKKRGSLWERTYLHFTSLKLILDRTMWICIGNLLVRSVRSRDRGGGGVKVRLTTFKFKPHCHELFTLAVSNVFVTVMFR
jgi:hypothetical protein